MSETIKKKKTKKKASRKKDVAGRVRKKILEMQVAGKTYADIAKATGLSVTRIWLILKEEKALKRDLTESNTGTILAMRKEGKTFSEIAKALDMPYTTVYSRWTYHRDI